MAGRVVGRFAVVGVMVSAMLGGAWVHAAVAKDKYSQSDCETITSIEVKGGNVITAGEVLVKAGKPYTDALTVFTKAQATCATQSFDSTSSTTEPDDS